MAMIRCTMLTIPIQVFGQTSEIKYHYIAFGCIYLDRPGRCLLFSTRGFLEGRKDPLSLMVVVVTISDFSMNEGKNMWE